jgi:hypothetical protein
MHDLPALSLSEPPDSVLGLAVRAVAFADLRNESAGNVPFYVKAQRNYGAALNRMRTIVQNQPDLSSDRILSAVLLIDNFEVTPFYPVLHSILIFGCVANVFGANQPAWFS